MEGRVVLAPQFLVGLKVDHIVGVEIVDVEKSIVIMFLAFYSFKGLSLCTSVEPLAIAYWLQ
jgi:uncharacterized protein (DUF4213/DUF364 family)